MCTVRAWIRRPLSFSASADSQLANQPDVFFYILFLLFTFSFLFLFSLISKIHDPFVFSFSLFIFSKYVKFFHQDLWTFLLNPVNFFRYSWTFFEFVNSFWIKVKIFLNQWTFFRLWPFLIKTNEPFLKSVNLFSKSGKLFQMHAPFFITTDEPF